MFGCDCCINAKPKSMCKNYERQPTSSKQNIEVLRFLNKDLELLKNIKRFLGYTDDNIRQNKRKS